MYLSMLLSSAVMVVTQATAQDDPRALAQTGEGLIECVVAARAASEDPETEITISADMIMAAYVQAEILFRQLDEIVRGPAFQEQIQGNPRDQFLFARSPAFTTGYMVGRAEAMALRSLNQDAMDQLDRDAEGEYDGFLDARVWSGFSIYLDNECEAKLAELAAN